MLTDRVSYAVPFICKLSVAFEADYYKDIIMSAMAPQITSLIIVKIKAPRHWPLWVESRTNGQ